MLTQYEVYIIFNGINRHFNSSYDYIKYNGKMKNLLKKNEFYSTNKKALYSKYSKHSKPMLEKMFVYSFIENKNFWISSYEEAMRNYLKHNSIMDSLTYQFTNEIQHIDKTLSKNISCEKNQHPYLLKLFFMKKISLEGLIIIIDVLGISDYWSKFLKDDLMWNDLHIKIEKFKPFFEYDTEKFKKIFVSHCKKLKMGYI